MNVHKTVAAIHRPIAIFDSGAGGISVLREVKKLLPKEQLLYFGDTRNAPYGERSDKEIRALVLSAAARLIPCAKALVLACNTATAVAAAELRCMYPDFPIIGMEPALLPAVSALPHPRVAVLATEATLNSEKFAQLRKRCEKSATVWPISAPGIVRLVELGLEDSPEMEHYLRRLFAPLPSRPDAVVLGCTHFPFAGEAIRRVLGDPLIFDGAGGTARELLHQLSKRRLLCTDGAGGTVLCSSHPAALPLLTRLWWKS